MQNNTMTKRENSLWISIAVLAVISILYSTNYLILLLFWSLDILVKGNVKRVRSEKHKEIFMFFRRNFYIIPYIIPFIFIDVSIQVYSELLVLGCLLAGVLGIVFILPQLKNWLVLISNDLISLNQPRSKMNYLTDGSLYLTSAIAEELFFRGFIIGYIGSGHSWPINILVSTILFTLSHFGTKWGEVFKLYDLFVQVLFSILSALMFILTKSILPSIFFHIIYNLPRLTLCVKSYYYHHYANFNIKRL